MNYYQEQLDQLRERIARKRKLSTEISALEDQRASLATRVQQLKEETYQEQLDVDKLENFSAAKLFAQIMGNLDERLEKERSELYAAALRYDSARQELHAVEADLAARREELSLLGNCEAEYDRLLETARERGQERLALLMETICATGIRVSEVRYITMEAAQRGRAEISLKGKIRTILLPGKLCRKLLKYARQHKTVSGEIFLTRNGIPLSRRQIWAELKRLCKYAGVEPSKVFPHNLRHLFATTFYKACKDIARLADVLGHSSIETTRIYLVTSGTEHARQLNRLGLVS